MALVSKGFSTTSSNLSRSLSLNVLFCIASFNNGIYKNLITSETKVFVQ